MGAITSFWGTYSGISSLASFSFLLAVLACVVEVSFVAATPAGYDPFF